MNKLFSNFINLISKADEIALFSHINPDGDALACVTVFKKFINLKFPSKKIYICDTKNIDKSFLNNLVINEFIELNKINSKNTLGIIFDLNDPSRIWSDEYIKCNKIIVIDHHEDTNLIKNAVKWIDKKYSSAIQMVAEFLFEWDKKLINIDIAKLIYMGIITDTGNLTHENVDESAFDLVGKLITIGVKPREILNILYSESPEKIKFNIKLFKKIKYFNKANINIAYIISPKKWTKKYPKIWLKTAWTKLSNISNIDFWLSFYYDDLTNTWSGSIRSKIIAIDGIAKKYNGGGHKLASGVKILNKKFKKTVKQILISLINTNI